MRGGWEGGKRGMGEGEVARNEREGGNWEGDSDGEDGGGKGGKWEDG